MLYDILPGCTYFVIPALYSGLISSKLQSYSDTPSSMLLSDLRKKFPVSFAMENRAKALDGMRATTFVPDWSCQIQIEIAYKGLTNLLLTVICNLNANLHIIYYYYIVVNKK